MQSVLISPGGMAIVTTRGGPNEDLWLGRTVDLKRGAASCEEHPFHITKKHHFSMTTWREATTDERAQVDLILAQPKNRTLVRWKPK